MSNSNLLQIEPQNVKPQQEDDIDLRKLFFKLLSYWHYFAIAIVVTLICAWLYNRYATTKYRVTSTLLIEEDKKGSAAIGSDKLLEGFGLRPGMQNLDNPADCKPMPFLRIRNR